jgi:hypothetical protein
MGVGVGIAPNVLEIVFGPVVATTGVIFDVL